MNYPFYTLVLARPDQLNEIVNEERPTYDQVLMAELVVFQESANNAVVVKNRWGFSSGHVIRYRRS